MNNWIDLTLGLIMIVSIVSGLRAGFAKTAVAFGASIVGLILGLHYYHVVGHSLHLTRPNVANIVGFLIVFCGISMVGGVASGILVKFVRTLDLVWLDRVLGGAFGVVRGVLYATVVVWGMLAFFPVPPKLVLSQSRLAPCVMDAARRVADASPDEVKRTFRQ
ncbi:MAG TPA: CvpA family protein, partial [Bryobacteraceae bacterium]|nr:CvpA family protein [Bryobacteraceae bacterium]